MQEVSFKPCNHCNYPHFSLYNNVVYLHSSRLSTHEIPMRLQFHNRLNPSVSRQKYSSLPTPYGATQT